MQMSLKPWKVLVGKESFNWENSQEHCILISGIDLIQDILRGPENIQGHLETLKVWPTCQRTRKAIWKQVICPQRIPVSFWISDIGRESKLIGGNQDVAWILATQKRQLLLPYWDGGAPFSVKRLPVYQRWHLIALHSPSLPLAKLSKTRQRADEKWCWWWVELMRGLSASELRSLLVHSGLIWSGLDWFNGLMRGGAAYLPADQLYCSPSV